VLHLDRASAPATSLATEEPVKTEHKLAQRQPWSDLVSDLGTAESDSSSIKGDGKLATKAQLHGPLAVAVDRSGTLYIADSENFRVRRVDPAGQIWPAIPSWRRSPVDATAKCCAAS
jgi:hypothetical protein